jgi:hypothetical protein
VCGVPQELGLILPVEMRGQPTDAAQVKPPVAKHGQEHRMLPRCSGRGDPQPGLGLGEMEHRSAVDKHRRCGLARVESSRVHFTNVSHEVGFATSGSLDKLGQVAEQLVVRHGLEISFDLHDQSVGGVPVISGPFVNVRWAEVSTCRPWR